MYSFALTSVTQFQLLIENFHIMLIKLLCTLLPPYIIYLASLRYSAVMDKLKSENAKTDAVPQSRIWPLFCNGDCLCVTEQGVYRLQFRPKCEGARGLLWQMAQETKPVPRGT